MSGSVVRSKLPREHCFSSYAGSQEAAQQHEASKSAQQLLESSSRLLRVKYDTQQAVTAIKVQGDELETTRRDKEEHLRQVLVPGLFILA